MISYRVPRLRFIALICALLLLLAALISAPLPAGADEGDNSANQVQVSLETVTPTVLGTSGELRLHGTVTNTTDAVLEDLTVSLWRDARPITSLALLNQATAMNSASGAVMQSPSARDELGDGTLDPGETKEFTVRAEMGADAAEQTWLSAPGAAYRIGVEVDSLTRWSDEPLGAARTFIALPGETKAQVAPVVQLNATPTMTRPVVGDRPAVFSADQIATELSTQIIPLTDFAEKYHAKIVVDPLLIDEVTALAKTGYSASGLATSWLTKVSELLATGQVVRGLAGSPDIHSLLSVDEELAVATATVASTHLLANAPLWVIPADGLIDENLLAKFSAAQVVLASNTNGTSGDTKLLWTSAVTGPPTSAGIRATMAGAKQIVAATDDTELVQVIIDTADVEIFAKTAALREVISTDEITADGPIYFDEPKPAIDDELAQTTKDSATILDTWCAMVSEAACPRQLLAAAWSTRWHDAAARGTWLAELMATPRWGTGPDGVTLTVSDWVTTSASDNQLPVSVTNHTNQVISVAVAFTSANNLRIEVPDSDIVRIGPGETSSVRVSPKTHGNGVVGITAQPVAPNGQLIGVATEFSATGTDAGKLGWLIIIGSGVVLLGGTAMRVKQVRNHAKNAAAGK